MEGNVLSYHETNAKMKGEKKTYQMKKQTYFKSGVKYGTGIT